MSSINYVKRDIKDIRSAIIEAIQKKNENITQFNASDPAGMILDAVAEVADGLHYYIDRSRFESYLPTCVQKDSLRYHAELSSYFLKGVQPPSVVLEVTAVSDRSLDRLELDFDGTRYSIIDNLILDATNDRKTQIVAYNGVLTTKWVDTANIDKYNPVVVLGDYRTIPRQGMKVYLESESGIRELPVRSWYARRNDNEEVEVAIRDNEVNMSWSNRIHVKYLTVDPDAFGYLDTGAKTTSNLMNFTAIEPSTSGAREETYEESRRNIIYNNRVIDTLVSTMDYKYLAEQDSEIAKAVAFDRNTPSIVSEINKVVVYLKLKDDRYTVLPKSITSRLDAEVKKKSVVLGNTHEWRKGVSKVIDIYISIFAYSLDEIKMEDIEKIIKDQYSDMSFGQAIKPSEIEYIVARKNPFISYAEVTSPASIVKSEVNEIPVIGKIYISLNRELMQS